MRTFVAALVLTAGLKALATSVSAQQPQTPLQRLEASVQRTTRSVNATWGVYVKSIETGEDIALDADRQMETMSTIKIPLMVEVFEQITTAIVKADRADRSPWSG